MSPPPLTQDVRNNDGTEVKSWSDQLKSAALTVLHHARRHTGVGMVCAVAYFDPYDPFFFLV